MEKCQAKTIQTTLRNNICLELLTIFLQSQSNYPFLLAFCGEIMIKH
jgi:hypothetical protein